MTMPDVGGTTPVHLAAIESRHDYLRCLHGNGWCVDENAANTKPTKLAWLEGVETAAVGVAAIASIGID